MREPLRSRLSRDWLFWVWTAVVLPTVVVAIGRLVRTIDPSAEFDAGLVASTIGTVVVVVVLTSAVVVLVALARGELGNLLVWLDAQVVHRGRAREMHPPTQLRPSGPLRSPSQSPSPGSPVVRDLAGSAEGESWRSDAAMLATFGAEVTVIRSIRVPAGPLVQLTAHVDVVSTSITSVQEAVAAVLQRQEGLRPPPAPPLTPIGVPAGLLRRLDSAPRGTFESRLGTTGQAGTVRR